ncbi:hypothetical protein PoB_007148200 [Plakobranchus ocellatus]|uniref:Uncharacterized protein n=1 Tax=Plakobranchus ocellatus TaxID=259542 RepID=A0AAV4DLQ9_9GAST|nr:hypothetical protein PoB_007148200 [Plakobranchus ocellatus]
MSTQTNPQAVYDISLPSKQPENLSSGAVHVGCQNVGANPHRNYHGWSHSANPHRKTIMDGRFSHEDYITADFATRAECDRPHIILAVSRSVQRSDLDRGHTNPVIMKTLLCVI